MRVAVSPTISEMLARSEIGAAQALNTSVTRATILTNWPFYLILATMGPALLSLFGPEFTDGAVVLTILAGAMMVSAAAGMLQSILLQGGKSSWQMGNKGMALAISIGLNLLLVPAWGILGAAVTWAFAILAETALASWQVQKRMGVLLQPRKLLLAMAIPLVIFGVGGAAVRLTFGTSLLALLVALVGLVAVYLVVLWFLRVRLGIVSLWRELPLIGSRAEPARRSRSAAGRSATAQNAGERVA
jgi:O-antigen/teichoic acid export membrane protein